MTQPARSSKYSTAHLIIMGLMFFTAGCGATADLAPQAGSSDAVAHTSPSSNRSEPSTTIIVPETVPPVDTSKRIVELEDVYFDTFRPTNRAVPLSDADPDLIEQLRDAIPPIHNPQYESAAEARWLTDDDMVLGYAVGEEAWAYPLRILNFHEIVNEHLGGEPVVVSFCPLCYSGVVFSRVLTLEDGSQKTITFGNTSALYESDMVMLDYETGSYWWHVAGKAIVGELVGTELELRSSMTISWAAWKELYPNTLVLSRDTGFNRNYERDPFVTIQVALNRGNFAFPVSEAALDDQLPPGAEVLTVKINGEARAYPLAVDGTMVVMESVGGEEIAVFLDPEARSGSAFVPTIDGQSLTFEVAEGVWVDQETGTTWSLSGQAIEGGLVGQHLELLPAKITFWFATVASEPEVTVYQP